MKAAFLGPVARYDKESNACAGGVLLAACPRCKQGEELYEVRMIEIETPIYVCLECDATWLEEGDIGVEKPLGYESYMKSLGLDSNDVDTGP